MSAHYPALVGRLSPPRSSQYAAPHYPAIDQTINQSNTQPISQHSQPINQHSQSVNQHSQPINQSVNQHSQHINQHSQHGNHGHHGSHPYTPHMQHPHIQAANQTNNQSNQPLSANQPVNHSNFHSHHQPYTSPNQPNNQPISQPINQSVNQEIPSESATLDWQWFDSFAFQQTPEYPQQHHHHHHSNQPISHVNHVHHHVVNEVDPAINHHSHHAPPGSYGMPVPALNVSNSYPPTSQPGYQPEQLVYGAPDRQTAIGTSPISYGRVIQMAQPAVAPTVAFATYAAPAVKRKPRRKLACSNCRHVKSECSGERPCRRCVRLNKAHTCADPTEPYPPKKPKTKKEPKEVDIVKQEKKEQSTDGDDDDDGDNDDDGDSKDKDSNEANGDSAMSPNSTNPRTLQEGAQNDDEEPRDGEYAVPSAYYHCIAAFVENLTRAPIVVTPQSTIGVVRRMGHLFETMPPGVFETLLSRMGYVPQQDSSPIKEEPRDPIRSPLSNSDSDALEDHSNSSLSSGVTSGRVKKVIWRSPHMHLPYVSLPHRFRLNWSLTPDTAFDESESLCQTFPTLMWMHCPPAAHFVRKENGTIVPCPIESDYPINYTPENPLPPLQEGEVPLEPHEIDLSATEQFGILLTNTAFERLFGYTQHEMKRMFTREGKRAFVRLFESNIHSTLGNNMKRLNQEGTTEFRHFAVIRTKFNTTLPVLMLRKLLVDQDGFVLINRYTFISLPGAEELHLLQNHFTGSNNSSNNNSSSTNESANSFSSN